MRLSATCLNWLETNNVHLCADVEMRRKGRICSGSLHLEALCSAGMIAEAVVLRKPMPSDVTTVPDAENFLLRWPGPGLSAFCVHSNNLPSVRTANYSILRSLLQSISFPLSDTNFFRALSGTSKPAAVKLLNDIAAFCCNNTSRGTSSIESCLAILGLNSPDLGLTSSSHITSDSENGRESSSEREETPLLSELARKDSVAVTPILMMQIRRSAFDAAKFPNSVDPEEREELHLPLFMDPSSPEGLQYTAPAPPPLPSPPQSSVAPQATLTPTSHATTPYPASTIGGVYPSVGSPPMTACEEEYEEEEEEVEEEVVVVALAGLSGELLETVRGEDRGRLAVVKAEKGARAGYLPLMKEHRKKIFTSAERITMAQQLSSIEARIQIRNRELAKLRSSVHEPRAAKHPPSKTNATHARQRGKQTSPRRARDKSVGKKR